MTNWGEEPHEPRKDNTTLWIVGGVALICLCAVGIGVIGLVLVGAAGFGLTSAGSTFPTSVPYAYSTNTPFPTSASVSTPTGDEPAGETIDVPDLGTAHVQEGASLTFNSNPPTSGPHYPIPLPAGFYTDSVPDGYVVHSLEHGYVVIWYGCESLSDDECTALEDDIQQLISYSSKAKLIGLPREGMPHIIALTSWTKLAYLDQFDKDFINDFIDANILHSPEPNGQ